MFGRKKQQGTLVGVFDISSSSVGGAHAIIPADTALHPTMLAQSRTEASLQEDMDIKRFVSDTVLHLQNTIERLRKADVHTPQRLQLVLASPWYVSQTRTIIYKKETLFTCTRKMIADLVDKEVTHVIAHELDRFGNFGKEGIVVEKQISLVKLNGYSTSDPYGKKAQSLELFLTLTVVPKKVIDQFTETLRRAYGDRHIGITTSPYAAFVTVRDYFNSAKDSMIIDVGEEVTDVAFVRDGLFLYQHSFPVGTYGLYRSIIEKEKSTALEAKALVEAFRLGKVSAVTKDRVQKALYLFSEQWRTALQEILNEGQYGFCLPELCYITADARFEGIFPQIIATDPFIQHMCSRGAINPVFMNATLLADKIKTLDVEVDAALATGILFTARII